MLAASAAAMAQASGVSFWSFGLYFEPIESEFGWSRAEVSLGFSLSLVVSGVLALPVGRWIDLQGPRIVIFSGTVLTSLTFLLLARTDSLWQWYFYLSLNAMFRTMMFLLPFQALLSRWFQRRHGAAVGVLGIGFAMGGLAMVPVMRIVIDTLEWRGSFVFAGVTTLMLFVPLLLFLIRDTPEEVGLTVDGDPVRADASRPVRDVQLLGLTLGQAIHTPLFWTLALAITLFISGLVGWTAHTIPFYESVNISRSTGSLLFSAAAGISIIPRLTFGIISDRFHRVELGAMVLAGCLCTAILVYLLSTSAPAIAVFLLLWGIGAGGGPLMEPLLLTRAFGRRHFGSILGFVLLVEAVGQFFSPLAAGAIFDATGTYHWALVMLAVSFAAAILLFFAASRLVHPASRHIAPNSESAHGEAD